MASLAGARAGAVSLDEETATMLAGRFCVARDAGARLLLQGELARGEAEPSLLGRPVACVGRSRELSILEGVLAGCVGEPTASAVLVSGPAGVGKSRLCHEFLKSIRRRGEPLTILVGRASSLGAGSIFGMIADAIRKAAGIRDDEPLEGRRARLEQRLARHLAPADLPRVAAFLGELIGAPFPDGHHEALRAARQSPMLFGDAMRTAWEDWLTAECAASPVLLVLEDLHGGDAATVRLVDATLRNLRDLPLMVLALARPEVQEQFPALWADREVHSFRLGSLSRKASERLVRDTLGEGASAALVARIVDHGGGNPFYLEELVRAVVAGRGESFPDSVLGTVEARLDAEGSEAKRVLRAASVFGERFSRNGVAALLGGESDLAVEWLDVLCARELIVPASAPSPSRDAQYAFAHALVREAAYATLVEADRALGHLLAGEWLERMGHPDALEMAEHFRRGGEPARSARWYRRAAEQALEASDLRAAIDRAELGAGGDPSPEDRGGLLLVEAEAHLWRGDLALAEQRGLAATAYLTVGSAAWFRAVTQVVNAAGKLGGTGRVEAWIEPVSAAIPAEGAAGTRIICLCSCATHVLFGGRYAVAEALIAAVERTARAAPELDAEATAVIQQARSFLASARGDLGGCLEACRAALTAFEQAEDHRNACSINGNLGFVFAELGDFDGAERALCSAQAAASRLGLHNLAAVAAHNLGHVLARLGRLDEAQRIEQGAVEAFRQQGERRLEGAARTYLAEIALLAGDLAAAEREARAAAAALEVAPSCARSPSRSSAACCSTSAAPRRPSPRPAKRWPRSRPSAPSKRERPRSASSTPPRSAPSAASASSPTPSPSPAPGCWPAPRRSATRCGASASSRASARTRRRSRSPRRATSPRPAEPSAVTVPDLALRGDRIVKPPLAFAPRRPTLPGHEEPERGHMVRHRVPLVLRRQAPPRGRARPVPQARRRHGHVARLRARSRRSGRAQRARDLRGAARQEVRIEHRPRRGDAHHDDRDRGQGRARLPLRARPRGQHLRRPPPHPPRPRARGAGRGEGRLLRAYMTEGEPIGDRDALVRLAAEAGLDAEEARATLATNAFADEVRADEQQARELGINGVPFFVIGGYGVSGAQPAEGLLRVLARAWDEAPGGSLRGGAACGPDGCA